MLDTPILFLLFNRPDTTARVFAAIRQARPKFLYVAADGPRADRPGEQALCAQARELVLRNIDWDCQVFTLLRERNLGCKAAVSSALDWFFRQVEEGIILEDDTLPDASFFPYCEALLAKHRHEPRVLHISGDNFQFGRRRGTASYYFSIYPHIWGWATWRRAWNLYDPDIKAFPAYRDSGKIRGLFREPTAQKQWLDLFDQVYQGKIDTWDYQWIFALWNNGGLATLPETNLVSNIGFREDATHTKQTSRLANLKTHPLGPLLHPAAVAQNAEADQFSTDYLFTGKIEDRTLFPVL